MSISILQALLLGVIYYLGNIGTPWTTVLGSASIFQKPLVAGLLTGVVLGHPVEGLLIGAAIQLPYISYISAGSTVPSDPGLAGVVGTCLAICGGFDPLAAIAIGIPFGLVGTKIWVYHMTVDAKFVHKADKAAEEGDLKKICFYHVVPPQLLMAAICITPVFLVTYLASPFMAQFAALLGTKGIHVLRTIGGVMPALSVAINLRAVNRPNTMAFYILGFAMTVFLGLEMTAVAVIGGVIAWFYTQSNKTAN